MWLLSECVLGGGEATAAERSWGEGFLGIWPLPEYGGGRPAAADIISEFQGV
jgi:hypothetical protein